MRGALAVCAPQALTGLFLANAATRKDQIMLLIIGPRHQLLGSYNCLIIEHSCMHACCEQVQLCTICARGSMYFDSWTCLAAKKSLKIKRAENKSAKKISQDISRFIFCTCSDGTSLKIRYWHYSQKKYEGQDRSEAGRPEYRRHVYIPITHHLFYCVYLHRRNIWYMEWSP